MKTPRIKICCISSTAEARLALKYRADALGLVAEMPSGPGVIEESLIAEIADSLPPTVASFLLTSFQDADSIIAQQRRCRTNTIQICDRLLHGSHADLRKALPGIKIVQVIHVVDEGAIDEAVSAEAHVDALLLDSGNPALAVKTLGGTGQTHNWEISRRLVERVNVPVFLAGGLNAGNAAAALASVRPFGLDICSGVRENGHLNEAKLAAFMAAARG